MPSFGQASFVNVATCCLPLQETLYLAIQKIDFSAICGARDKQTQNQAVVDGTSTLVWPNSKHNITAARPWSDAVDVWPYTKWGALSGSPEQIISIAEKVIMQGESIKESQGRVREYVFKAFSHMAGVILGIGFAKGHSLTWGGDWNSDGNMLDQNFHDLPHIEYARNK